MLEGILSGNPEDTQTSTDILAAAIGGLSTSLSNALSSYTPGDIGEVVSELGQFKEMVASISGAGGQDGKPETVADIWWVVGALGLGLWC